jgi:hypothetical protein
MRLEDFNDMISQAANQMPPATVFQPENELKPDPARLRARIDYLEMRLSAVEKWAKKMNPTFWNFVQFEMGITNPIHPTEG